MSLRNRPDHTRDIDIYKLIVLGTYQNKAKKDYDSNVTEGTMFPTDPSAERYA